jgi:8-oxo-dGTP pyrophosphatase MutT (NUDIX family)
LQPGQHRETARIILTNSTSQVFLLLTHFDPEVQLPPRWITPGGGIDDGETPLEAAIRELREETGLMATPEQLGEQIWRAEGKWHWGDGVNHHTYVDYFYSLKVDNFQLDDRDWTDDERRDVLEFRWWNVSDLSRTQHQVGPDGLIEFLNHYLA